MDEDHSWITLDSKPSKRSLQGGALSESGLQVHEHAEQGSIELAIVR